MRNSFYFLFSAIFAIGSYTAHAQTISTYVGNGTAGYIGDGGPATAGTVEVRNPFGVCTDGSGNLYFADASNFRVRMASSSGMLYSVAGIGSSAYSGDGTAASAAGLVLPVAVAADAAGNLYIADYSGNRIRKVTASTGVISTFAGTGTGTYTTDGTPASTTPINQPTGVAVDATGNVYIADNGNNRIRKVNTAGVISTFAGTGLTGSSGDGLAATTATFRGPYGVAVDAAGTLYISDSGNAKVRYVISSGTIYTLAGIGTSGFSGDGLAAGSAKLSNTLRGVAVDATGNIFFADAGNNRIRRISGSSFIITTVAGNGTPAFFGDGGPATASEINTPYGIAFDATNNMYIADANNQRIRKTTPLPSILIIGGTTPFCKGFTTTLSDATPGGVWSTSATVVTVGPSTGIVTGVAAGTATITYTTTTDAAQKTVTVACPAGVNVASGAAENGLKVYPNPNDGVFNIFISSSDDEQAFVTITNIVGVKVKELKMTTNTPLNIQLDAPPGIYLLNATTTKGKWSEKLTLLH